jgi:MYXO-CTERM domain-containing protein
MIATRTRSWWLRFSAAGILFSLGSCSSESIPPQLPIDDEPGALAGELVVHIANYDDGTAETRYFLKQRDGAERRLHFSVEPDVTPGVHLKVWGNDRADRIEVTQYKVVDGAFADDGIGSQAQPLVDATAKPSRVMCAALVNLNGGTAKSTLATIKTQFHTGTGSANAYYVENSFGQVGLSGDSYGPFPYSMTTCDYSGMAKAVKPMIDAVATTKCQQYAFVMGPNYSGCAWSGLGALGTSDKPATDTWYNDSISCVVVVQEPGHNYGMQHSSSLTCTGGPFADDLTSCTHSEYGDKYDTMGGGCYHMNSWQKLYQKWFGGCNGVRTTSNGKFNLYPIEAPCNGVQVLQLPFPNAKTRTFQSTTLTSYYLELRTKVGFDSKITAPQVFLHAGGAPIVPTQANPKGLHTWIITVGSPGMTAGSSFADPAGGLTITVDSVDATHAVVDVKYATETGTPVCLDGSNGTFTPPGPTDCSTPSTPGDAAPPPPPADARADTGGSGAAGTGIDAAGGTAGTAGSGGKAGTSGASGSSGGGSGGAAGTAGAGGTSGKGGAGGAGGTGGGSGGTTGSGGTGGGNAGDGGSGGTGGTRPATPEAVNGGCGCKLAGADGSERQPWGGLFMLGLGGLLATHRRRARVGRGS